MIRGYEDRDDMKGIGKGKASSLRMKLIIREIFITSHSESKRQELLVRSVQSKEQFGDLKQLDPPVKGEGEDHGELDFESLRLGSQHFTALIS